MKKINIFFLLLVSIALSIKVKAQNPVIYVSKQTGQSTSFNGNYGKQADRYESGSVQISTTGPVLYQLNPNELTIEPNQNKNWTGFIQGDANATTPGTITPAEINTTYDFKYSRPYGQGNDGTVESTYYCSDNGSAGGNGGCTHHNNTPGSHEIVHKSGLITTSLSVVSILAELPAEICLGVTGRRDITVSSFPAAGGNYQWSSTHPAVQIGNPNSKTANLWLTDTSVHNAVVTCKFSIGGVDYTASGTLSTCECQCRPITNGITVGPLTLSFNVNPTNAAPDAQGNCNYTANNAGFRMTLNDVGISRDVNIQNGAQVTFARNCQSNELSDVSINWTGDIEVPELEIRGVKVFKLNIKEAHLTVATNGNLSGSVKVKVTNTDDRDLSFGKKFIMLRKGTNSDVTFTFSGGNTWNGSFAWSGIQNIIVDLCKQSDGNEVKLANFTGNFSNEGVLAGNLTINGQPSYKTNLFKVQLKSLTLGLEAKLRDASFRLTSGSGTVQLSEMKATTGTIDLGLQFPEAGGCNANIAASNIKAFTMTLDEFNLSADFDRDFDLTKVEGSLKAKHNNFDVKINVDNFKIENGELKEFRCSGQVKYRLFKFNLTNGAYTSNPSELSVSARVEISATGTAAMLEVQNFKIKEDGEISVGSIRGSFNRAPATLSFSATFEQNRFRGDFNGEFAGIGLEGRIDVGSQENPDYQFGYLALTAKVNVPLGQTGLKLTRIGGQMGYNYRVTSFQGGGDPQQGSYVAGFTLGVADVGNMCEVTGTALIQFTSSSVDIGVQGTIAILKNNTFFNGDADVTYTIPAQTLRGSVGAALKIPGNGWFFTSRNLRISFNIGNGQFRASGSEMGGSMFGNIVQFSNGNFNLSGSTSSLSSVSGSIGGRASAGFNYGASVSAAGNTVSGNLSLNFNSDINASFDQNGLSGSFGVDVTGRGTLTFDTWIYSTTLEASANCNGNVSRSNGSTTVSGNITITLPFSVPFWGNTVSTGNVSVTL